MPDNHAEVPERVQKRPQKAFLPGGNAAAEEHQEIDIRMQAEVPPPVAAERDDRHRPFGRPGVDEQLPQQRVHPIGVTLERRAAAGAAGDVGTQLVTCGVERRAKR